MTKEEFQIKFESKGGLKTLFLMMHDLKTLEEIADHFGITKQRIGQIQEEMFKEKYDPRKDRKERDIQMLLKAAVYFGADSTLEMFKEVNKGYKDEFLKRHYGLEK